MYSLIPQITLFASLAVIVYLFIKVAPRVDEAAEHEDIADRALDLLDRLPLEQIDGWISKYLEKFLRKVKVAVLKFDNTLTKGLDKVRETAPDSQDSSEEHGKMFDLSGDDDLEK